MTEDVIITAMICGTLIIFAVIRLIEKKGGKK